MKLNNVFITGTDTGVGKTWFTVALMNELKLKGLKVAGMKPIASGSEWNNGRWENEDALQIMQACSEDIDYEVINPIAFEPPIAPHIAADLVGETIDIRKIHDAYQALKQNHDIVIVEGVGGWRVPLSAETSLCDLTRQLQLSVILVVGLRLGCINHAVLSAEVIRRDEFELSGWVATELDPAYLNKAQTLSAIQTRLQCPMLVEMPYSTVIPSPEDIQINIDCLS